MIAGRRVRVRSCHAADAAIEEMAATVVMRTAGQNNLPRHENESEHRLIEIKLKKNEPVEKGLRRLKKQMMREGVIQELRRRRSYEKPSAMKRRKMKVAKFGAMLKQRHADD